MDSAYHHFFTNATLHPIDPPFYYVDRPTLVNGVSDEAIALAAPVVSYWLLSGFFHFLDVCEFQWLEKYRIHDSVEEKSRNRATRMQVVRAVILQHAMQTVLGFFWLEKRPIPSYAVHRQNMNSIAEVLVQVMDRVLGAKIGSSLLEARGHQAVNFLYWWGIPIVQFLFAMFVIDSWQYFLHRAMHVNKFLYKHLHSVHHRLYVPYAFGALYNHPIEALLLDILGTGVAEMLSCMTTRQSILLFTISACKTVDDHCGYRLPFDPLQMVTSNNADYHDIHHQQIGIKSNFSQPFFIHWDYFLGTRMTRKDIELRRAKAHQKTL